MKHFPPYTGIVLRGLATALLTAGFMILGSGCATAPEAAPAPVPTAEIPPARQPEPEPAPPTAAPVVVKPPKIVEAPSAPAPEISVAPAPVPAPAGRLSVRIESNPAGAMIVIDGRPIGRAPISADFDAVNNGFFKEPVTIRARFLASDANSESRTVEERLGPLDRIPQTLLFSPDGAQRVIRQY